MCHSQNNFVEKRSSLVINNYEQALKNIKGFLDLVNTNWKFEKNRMAFKDPNKTPVVNPQ